MVRKFLIVTVVLVVAYVGLIQWKMAVHVRRNVDPSLQGSEDEVKNASQRVYSFSFSKYMENGERELEIQGDTADILAQQVKLINVIAKAYAEDSPVTITADTGTFDKSTSDVLLRKNVVATTEDGARLLTNELLIHPDSGQMETEIQTKVKRDNIHIDGVGARSDANIGKVRFKKNVTVIVQDPNTAGKNPTIITCDGPLDIDYNHNIAHFKKNVVAQDDRGTLTADYMDVYYNKADSRVSKMVARGNVVIESKEGNKTFSDNAIYLANDGRVILGGDVDADYQNQEMFLMDDLGEGS